MLGGLLGIGEVSENIEKRHRAALPPFPDSFEKLPVYPTLLDQYIQDNFGFRKYLVQLPRIRYWLDEGATVKAVLLGRDRWLFPATNRIIEKHLGVFSIEEQEIHNFFSEMALMDRMAKKSGAKTIFIIAPDKQTIYPEKLPGWARPRSDNWYSQLEQRALKDGVPLLEGVPALLEAAKAAGDQVYFRDDTHWTDLGALHVFRMVASKYGVREPKIMMHHEQRRVGDLMQMLNLPELAEITTSIVPDNMPAEVPRCIENGPDRGDYPYMVRNGQAGKRIVLIGDSNALFLRPFFQSSASVFGWASFGSKAPLQKLIQEVDPELVIFLRTERLVGG